jgi:hypothetical protein
MCRQSSEVGGSVCGAYILPGAAIAVVSQALHLPGDDSGVRRAHLGGTSPSSQSIEPSGLAELVIHDVVCGPPATVLITHAPGKAPPVFQVNLLAK